MQQVSGAAPSGFRSPDVHLHKVGTLLPETVQAGTGLSPLHPLPKLIPDDTNLSRLKQEGATGKIPLPLALFSPARGLNFLFDRFLVYIRLNIRFQPLNKGGESHLFS